MTVNWCTSCKCVLANEEVVNGVCERCGSEVVRKVKSQWMLKITEYAQRLIDDLDLVDYPERVKTQQKNWIGRSTGAEVDFDTTAGDKLTVYTTRPDTLYGATYMVLSPEHPYLEKWADKLAKPGGNARPTRQQAARKSDFERTEVAKEKTGVKLAGRVGHQPRQRQGNPHLHLRLRAGLLRHRRHHGRARPRHPGLGVRQEVRPAHHRGGEGRRRGEGGLHRLRDRHHGQLRHSGRPDRGGGQEDASPQWLEEKGIGHAKVNYKLRDWVFSRQRYWGEPIPVVYCEKCGWVPLPESQLPLQLPEVEVL